MFRVWRQLDLLRRRLLFAYLRALAEGLDPRLAAERYLNASGAVEIRTAHARVVEQARAAARRHGDPGWRLLGVELDSARYRPERPARDPKPPPPIEQWVEEKGLDGWSQKELLELYEQQFPASSEGADGARDPGKEGRVQSRNARLRERRLRLLRELERVAQAPAQATDLLAGWFDDTTVQRLNSVGATTLGDVQRWSLQGVHWWAAVPALGPVKGRAIAASVTRLVGKPEWAIDWPRSSVPGAYDGRRGTNRQLQERVLIDARDDRAAIAAWVDARAGFERTRVVYTREAERFLLWCLIERGRALSEVLSR